MKTSTLRNIALGIAVECAYALLIILVGFITCLLFSLKI